MKKTLGSLALICCSLFSTILLHAAVTLSAAATATTVVENEKIQVRLTLHQTEALQFVPSCQHSFSQVEIMNLHASDTLVIESIQTTPEETLLVRYDPDDYNVDNDEPPQPQQASDDDFFASLGDKDNDNTKEKDEDIFASSQRRSSSSWDQRSIPQQIHAAVASRMPATKSGKSNNNKKKDGSIQVKPGESVMIPITYLPRYPCTLGHNSGDSSGGSAELEDYYAQQVPYQIAFSSTFDPDDDEFSLAQPPPPQWTQLISGTARADWEQLLKDMPPQERSNWLQQQQQQQNDDNSDLDRSQQQSQHHQQQQQQQQQHGDDSDRTTANTLEWIFEVRTTVLAQTSRGSVQLPVRASSRRQNTYGLPDVIYFDQQQEEAASSSSRQGGSKQSASPQPNDPNNQKIKGVMWLDTDLAAADSSSTDDSDDDGAGRGDEDERSPNTSRDCYNLFMTNPNSEEQLKVTEVYLSRPDQMNLQIQGQLRAPSHSISQWWNTLPRNDTPDGSTGNDDQPPQQQLGSLLLGPGEQHYVVTVCTAESSSATQVVESVDSADTFDPEDEAPLTPDSPQSALEIRADRAAIRAARMASSAEHSLGYLHVKTESGQKLFVALERLQKQCQSDKKAGGSSSEDKTNETGMSPQASPSVLDQQPKQQAYPPVYHTALYKAQDDITSIPPGAQAGKAAYMTAPASPLAPSVLSSEPERLDFSLLSSSSPEVVSYLGIRNPKNYPIKIMRSGVAVEVDNEQDGTQPNPQELGLHMSVKIKNNMLGADGLTEEALKITCKINWDLFEAHKLESLFFHGNAILRATSHVDYNYQQWIKNLVKTNSKTQQGQIFIGNDYADGSTESDNTKQTEFVLEIPLSVSIAQGKIGIMIHRTSHPFPHLWSVQSWKEGLGSVSSIFYPQRAFDVKAELDSGESPITEPIFGRNGIEHKLRVFANIHMPSRVDVGKEYQGQTLQLASATIAEGDGNNHNTNVSRTTPSGICDRFNLALAAPPDGDFPFQGFHDVGIVHIKYQFPDAGDSDLEDQLRDDDEQQSFQSFPTYCYLSFTTDPFTESHKIPLIVYPGQSEIAGMQSSRPGAYTPTENLKKKKDKQREGEGRKVDEPVLVGSHALVGFDDLVRWFRSSKVGSSLRDFLQKETGDSWVWSKRDYRNDLKLLEAYVQSLFKTPKSANLHATQLRPILLKVGAIRHGTVETSSFYMTNHNPVPLLVSVDVGEVEGMSISLARVPTRGQGDGHNILDHFPKQRSNPLGGQNKHLVPLGEHKGHPLEGLRKFLQTSETAQQFLGVFRFRDAISISQTAVGRQPLLNILYKKYAFGEFHRDPLPIRFGEDGWSKCHRRAKARQLAMRLANNLTNIIDDEDDEDDLSTEDHSGKGPLLISEGASITRELKVCWDKDAEPEAYTSDGTYTIVPPGAIARFDLKLHAPPRAMLRDDITRFLSTGLVLSTDHGEIMPVFVTFEALLGELQVSATNQTASGDAVGGTHGLPKSNSSVIQVPVNLFHETQLLERDTSVLKSAETKVPLSVQSSFSRDVRLIGMTSCNPWFEVSVDDGRGSHPLLPSSGGSTSNEGLHIANIRSAINCKARMNSIAALYEYPSFFQCATNWLASRGELQPQGCGSLQVVQRRLHSHDESALVHFAEHGGVKRALVSFEKALLVSSFAFENSSIGGEKEQQRRTGDGIVAPIVLDVFAEAWDAWRVVADHGLRMLTSTLKATIEYDSSTNDPKTQNLSVSMRDTIMATTLATPKLFDDERANSMAKIPFAFTGDDTNPSVVEFYPTLVAGTSSLSLPLRNPTAVPVRVRLAVVPNAGTKGGGSVASDVNPLIAKFGVDDDVRDSFIGHHESPFIQSRKLNSTTQHYHGGVLAEQLWWDGSGGYFLADEYGDLLRSHHNVRIVADGGAQVSLANPSLHSNVALLVGCGVRCGVRDEKYPQQAKTGNETSRLTSPIGAAAAAGITIAGRTRSNLPQANVRVMDEPMFSAGADVPGRKGGPAAFALPYSALEDIVIPPFGQVEVGPILFRPPGRHSVHGCQASSDSRSVHTPGNEEKAKACSSNIYESMVYLENSLSGLERISLRGKALWERIVFIDPPPPSDARYTDDFGNIELRHGHSAMMFSGSKSENNPNYKLLPHLESTVPGSVVKEVLVFNSGDTVVEFNGVHLSGSAKLRGKQYNERATRYQADVCSFKQFRLLNCLDEEGDIESASGLQNIRRGFTLEPGQNVSLYVEHFPDCSLQREFVTINLERSFHGELTGASGKFGLLSKSGSDNTNPLTSEKSSSAFRQRKYDLLVGFEMNDSDFKSCEPIRRWGYTMSDLHNEARCATKKNCRGNWFSRLYDRLFHLGYSALVFGCTAVIMVGAYGMTNKGYMFRRESSDLFSSALGSRRKTNDNGSTDTTSTHHWNWSAAFRCLARSDPSSADLQAIGREQIRHVVLGRYKNMGILSPQCFNSNGVFNRERGGVNVSGSPSRQIQGKEGSTGGGDRKRTLSDAIYTNCSTHQHAHLQRSLPCGLSWRVAVARGVALPALSENPAFNLHTSALLRQRMTGTNTQEHKPDDLSGESESEEDEEASSSSEESDDESEAQVVEEDDASLRQDSFVSELSEDNAPETPDDLSEEIVVSKSKEDGSNQAKEGTSLPPPPPGFEAFSPVVDDLQSKASSQAADMPREEQLQEKEGVTAGKDDVLTSEFNVVTKTTVKITAGDNLVAKKGKKEDDTAASQPKKEDNSQEEKNEKKQSRQKSKGKLSVSPDGSSDNTQPKTALKKETRSKTNDPNRPAKGRAVQETSKPASDKSKQTSEKGKSIVEKGRQTSRKDREKKMNASTLDGKGGKTADVDPKANKKRGNKGEAAEGSKKNAKDRKTNSNAEKTDKPDRKSKSARKKEKKARIDKAASAVAPRKADQEPESALAGATTAPTPEPILRPPPGLAPPPGFGGQQSAAPRLARPAYDMPLLTPAAFLSDTGILGSPSSALLGTPSRSGVGDSPFGLSPSILGRTDSLRNIGGPLPHPTGESLLAGVVSSNNNSAPLYPSHNSSTEGFDVMDFLDSILDDSASPPGLLQEASPNNNLVQAPLGVTDPPDNASLFLTSAATALPNLSLDPWATERTSSRISTYGFSDGASLGGAPITASIARTDSLTSPPTSSNTLDALNFLSNDGGGGGGSGSGIGILDVAAITSIPLLQSAAILQHRDADDDDEDDDNGNSFYASLLGKSANNNNNDDDESRRY